MRIALICLSIVCLALISSGAFAQTNILANPGFEEGTGTPPPPWITYGGGSPSGNNAIFAMETVSDRVHSGSKSFSVTGTTTTPILGSNGPRQWAIPIDPSGKTKYQLKAYIKKTANLKVRLRWHQLDNLGNLITAGYSSYDTGPTGVWRQISTDVLQLTAGARYLTFTCYVEPNGGINTGSVYIDDCGVYATPGGTEFGKVIGTVRYAGMPVPGAAVGVKQSAAATADALMYAATDANGNFGPVYIPNGTIYVAAWKEGWAPSADVTVTGASGTQVVANPVLTIAPGANLSLPGPNRTPQMMYSSQSGAATQAFDNDLSTQWSSTNSGADQYIIIDLDPDNGNTFDISGVTIYWAHMFPSAYTVDYTAGAPNPVFGWTTVYSATAASGGYQADPDDPFVDAIRFSTPVNARGIRIHCTAFNGLGIPIYAIWEAQIHYAGETMGSVYGYVRNPSGNPVEGALVHLGPATSDGRFYRQMYTDASGFYSFAWFSGAEILTADAFGYSNIDLPVLLSSDGTCNQQDIALPTKEEVSLVPNWNFEEEDPANPGKPAHWTCMEWDPQGEVIFSRATDHNHTPGGTACGQYDMRYITDPESDDKWAGLYSDMFPIKGDGLHAYNVWIWRAARGWETYRNTHRILWIDSTQQYVVGSETYGFYGWGRWDQNWEWWRTDAQYRLVPPYGAAYMIVDQIGSLVAYNNGEPAIQAIDDVVVEEVPLAYPESNSIAEVRSLEDGTRVSLVAKQLTAVPGGGVPTGVAYMEELDRSTGIRLDATGTIAGDGWVGPGDAVNISGTVWTTPEGEEYISVEIVTWLADTRPVDVVGMNIRNANNLTSRGLLVKLCGTVKEVGLDYFALDDGSTRADGSPLLMKVYCGTVMNKPVLDELVRVRGIISTDGADAVLYMRDEQVDWVDGASAIQPLPLPGPVKALRDYLFLGLFGDGLTPQATQLATDYLAAATGGAITESTVSPSLGDVVDANHTWFRHDGLDEVVYLNRIFSPADVHRRTAYAHMYVWSPTAQIVDIPVGSDDGIRVWVNGNLVWSNDYVTRTVNYGQDCIAGVQLNAGLNSVLFKVCNGSGDYFQFVSQFAVPGTWLGEGWGGSEPMEGLGYLLNRQP